MGVGGWGVEELGYGIWAMVCLRMGNMNCNEIFPSLKQNGQENVLVDDFSSASGRIFRGGLKSRFTCLVM